MSETSRRRFLATAGALLAAPSGAWAQQRSYRVGLLSLVDNRKDPYAIAFVERLSELGFAEGRNLSLAFRQADSRLDRLPALAAELAGMNCDVFFAAGNEANLLALKEGTRDTPIVFVALDFDLVATRHVSNMARPGGRITGVNAVESALPAKRVELLKDLLPRARKVAVLANEQTKETLAVAQEGARALKLDLHVLDLKRPPFNFESAFEDAVRAKDDAILVLPSAFWVPARRKLTELALKANLPSMFPHAQWAAEGGLLSYGYSFPAMFRRGAEMVAKVLRGAKVGQLPVEQPSVYELAVNLKTAKALGMTIPQSFLFRADRVID